MQKIAQDWAAYLTVDVACQYAIIDPPWNFDDKPPKAKAQLAYTLWDNNAQCLEKLGEGLLAHGAQHLFLWCPTALLHQVLPVWAGMYKTLITWVKQTKWGKLFYGLGNTFRNSTEQLIVCTAPGAKPLRSHLRNVHHETARKRTGKPRGLEVAILQELADRGFVRGAYLFSGMAEVECFQKFDIDLVDTGFAEDSGV